MEPSLDDLDRAHEGTARRVARALRASVPETTAARHLRAIRAATRARSHRRRRVAFIAVAAILAVAMLGGTAVAASGSALPGDLLYGVKRARERVSLALERDAGEKAKMHLAFADRRLVELHVLQEARLAGDAVDVGAAMSAYNAQLAAAEANAGKALGRDGDALRAHVLAQIDKHVQKLMALLETKENTNAREAIQRAIDNASTAKDRVGQGPGKGSGKPDDNPGRGRESAPGQNKPTADPAA